MHEATLEAIRQLTADMQKIVDALDKEDAPEARREAEFALERSVSACLKRCKQELLDELRQFHAEQVGKLERLKAKAARSQPASAHFRDSNHGLDDSIVEELVQTLLALPGQ